MAERGTQVARRGDRAVTRWDPWREIQDMRRTMDEMFSRFMGFTPLSRLLAEPTAPTAFEPPVDIYETPDEVVVMAYIPGMSKDAINLEVTTDSISLSGERKLPEVQNATWHVQGMGSGSFAVTYSLPIEIDPNKVKATYHEGVLEVRLPKSEAAKPKQVKVDIQG
jgi:HSP20 family protein